MPTYYPLVLLTSAHQCYPPGVTTWSLRRSLPDEGHFNFPQTQSKPQVHRMRHLAGAKGGDNMKAPLFGFHILMCAFPFPRWTCPH